MLNHFARAIVPGDRPLVELNTSLAYPPPPSFHCALGIAIIIRLTWRSHRFFAAVGRTEMSMMLFVYCIISLLQLFTIGGLVSRSRLFMMFLLGTCTALITTVVITSMDMALDPTKRQLGQNPTLFFFIMVFPMVAIVLYLFLIVILVYSELVVFNASAKLCAATHGHIKGSMFAIAFDIAAVSSIYKFWNTITD
ncbi:hypothetical protein BGZ73_006860, partial [Actinomortierella ambigua]